MAWRWFVIVGVTLLGICSFHGCGKPHAYNVNEPIPLGTTQLTVRRGETVTFRQKNCLAVFISWTGEREKKANLTERLWVMRRHFKVVDGSGSSYYPSLMMDEYSWRSLQQQTSQNGRHPQQLNYDKLTVENEFVMLLEIPSGTREMTFIVKNPWRDKKQPHTAAVRLGL